MKAAMITAVIILALGVYISLLGVTIWLKMPSETTPHPIPQVRAPYAMPPPGLTAGPASHMARFSGNRAPMAGATWQTLPHTRL